MKFQFKLALCGLIFLGTSCGYTLQGTRNPLGVKEGIRKIYIAPVINNTYKAGIEFVVYNQLVRTVLAHKQLVLVQDPLKADAILNGYVQDASYGGISGSPVGSLYPAGVGGGLPTAGFVINTIYNASLRCSFDLERTRRKPGKPLVLWASGFTRNKPFPSANQLDVPGTTSPLINESEFERALTDISRDIAADVHENMLDVF